MEANLLRVRDCMPIKLTVVEKTAVGPINLPASLTFKWLVKKKKKHILCHGADYDLLAYVENNLYVIWNRFTAF